MPDNIWSLSKKSKSYSFDRVVFPELILLNFSVNILLFPVIFDSI